VAAVGVAGRVRVVLEEQDIARDAVLAQPLLRLVQEILDDALAGLVVDDEIGDVVALGRRVFRVKARVEIEPRAIFEKDVGVAGAGNDLFEEVARDVVGREAPLAVERAGQAVLVLQTEDAPLHVALSLTGERAEGNYSAGGSRAKSRARRGPKEPAMRGVRGCTLSLAGD
jgi:hypothetical protein